jgi:hypothetical protein
MKLMAEERVIRSVNGCHVTTHRVISDPDGAVGQWASEVKKFSSIPLEQISSTAVERVNFPFLRLLGFGFLGLAVLAGYKDPTFIFGPVLAASLCFVVWWIAGVNKLVVSSSAGSIQVVMRSKATVGEFLSDVEQARTDRIEYLNRLALPSVPAMG